MPNQIYFGKHKENPKGNPKGNHWDITIKKVNLTNHQENTRGYAGVHPPVLVHTYPVTRKSPRSM